MFRKSSSDSLTLTIVDESYIFTSAKEFDFALSGRTCLPSAKMTSLVKLSDDELRREAEAIRRLEQKLADSLSGVIAVPGSGERGARGHRSDPDHARPQLA